MLRRRLLYAMAAAAALLGGLFAPVGAAVGVAGAAGTAGAAPSMPRYDHVFMMVEENHGYSQIIGNAAAPNLNRLAQTYGTATDYTAVAHPSLPNYVAMLGGSTFGIADDDTYWNHKLNQSSLMSQLEGAHQTWHGYLQNMPYAGYRGFCYPVRCLGIPDSDTLYIAKHNGLPYFTSVSGSPREMAKMQPFQRLRTDLATGHVANFNYLMPDECTDMHGAPPVCVDSGNPGDVNDTWLVSHADTFVGQTVAEITRSPVWRSGSNAIVLTFDEGADGDNSGCCGTNPGAGKVVTIVITNHGLGHVVDPTPYNHYSLLSTLQHAFGLGCLQATCDTKNIVPMTPLFADHRSAVTTSALLPTASAPAVKTPAPASGQRHRATAVPVTTPGGEQCTPSSWQVLLSPNLSGNDNNLASVSAGSPSDVWAVGNYYTDADSTVFRNLGVHWDGHTWTAVAVPNNGPKENTLFGVTTLPSGQAWAVGYFADAQSRIRTLAEHYDGHAWQIVPTPNPSAGRDMFFGVAALSDHDVWAVGGRQDGLEGKFHTLVEHWDGKRWSVQESADPGPNGNELFGVTASVSGGVWTVGQQQGEAFPGGALAEKLQNGVWRTAAAPRSGSESYDPYAVTTDGRTVLAAGDQENGQSPQRPFSFALTSGGTQVLPASGDATGQNDFYGIGSGGGTSWAVGRGTDLATGNQHALIATLKGGRWTLATSPNPGGTAVAYGLGGVTVLPSHQAWAVGSTNDGQTSNRTLIEHTC